MAIRNKSTLIVISLQRCHVNFFIGVAFKHKFSRHEIRNHDAVYVQALLVAEEETVG